MPYLRAIAIPLGCAGFLAACAQGTSIDEAIGGGGAAGVGSGSSTTAAHSSAASVGATTSAAASSSSGSTSGGSSSSSSSSTGGGGCTFPAENTCALAQGMSSVAGDEGGTSTVMAAGSRWFQIHVTEESSSIFASDLSYTVTLTSPASDAYNLVVHEGPQDGNPNCAATPVMGTGTPKTVHAGWDDQQGFGGEDDSLWLSIEVQFVSGTDCGEYTLSVEGGT